jgi:hypothetical protein
LVFEGTHEVVGVGDVGILDAKVVDDERKGDVAGVVAPEASGERDGGIPIRG